MNIAYMVKKTGFASAEPVFLQIAYNSAQI